MQSQVAHTTATYLRMSIILWYRSAPHDSAAAVRAGNNRVPISQYSANESYRYLRLIDAPSRSWFTLAHYCIRMNRRHATDGF
jgi:hypothetical protein